MTPDEKRALLPIQPTTACIYGITGSGKDFQIATFAKWLFDVTGGKFVNGVAQGGLRTRLFQFDNGDTSATKPLVAAGVIDLVDVRSIPHPHLVAFETARGKVPELSGEFTATGYAKGKWVNSDYSNIGAVFFNGITAISEEIFRDLRDKDAKGENVGGQGSMSFSVGASGKEEADGWGTAKIGSSNLAHYQVWNVDSKELGNLYSRLALREQVLVVVTAAETKTKTGTIGPAGQGDRFSERWPGLVNLTFHLTREFDRVKKVPSYKLWLESHAGPETGGAMAIANARYPFGLPAAWYEKQPKFIEPANLGQAIKLVQSANAEAEKELTK